MDATTIQIGGTIILLFSFGLLFYEFRSMREDLRNRANISNETKKIQLQAFEKLTLFADRSSLKNLISRHFDETISATQMQIQIVQSLKTEYEYNVSQQIYVSPELWDAITKLKDQNIYVINQIADAIPNNSTAIELSKAVLQLSETNNADLSKIVLNALQFEAKKNII